MLSFGLYGKLLSVDDAKVTADVEIAPGTVITVHRQTLARVAEDTATETTTEAEPTTAAPAPTMELNGEPVYGERVDDPSEVEAAKRKTED
jgi:preprotein translocase subunit YajC